MTGIVFSVSLENPIDCHRCGKRTPYDKGYGHQEMFWAWECIFFWEVLDPVILENKAHVTARASHEIKETKIYRRDRRNLEMS